jgi:CHAD domain-containing protein
MKAIRKKKSRITRAPAPWNEALAGALREGGRRHRKLRRRFVLKLSAKSLHDLRIESRRLLAMVALAGDVYGRRFGKPRRRIKGCLRATGKLRDAQVQLGLVEELLPKFPEARRFLRRIRLRIDHAREKARRRLHRGKRSLSRGLREVAGCLDEPPKTRAADRPMFRAVNALVEHAAGLMSSARRDEAYLHRARVALKRLRYTVEALQTVLPGATGLWLNRLRKAQHAMGDVHDCEVLTAALRRYVAKRPDERRRLRRLEGEFETRRRRLRGKLRLSVPAMPARLQSTFTR